MNAFFRQLWRRLKGNPPAQITQKAPRAELARQGAADSLPGGLLNEVQFARQLVERLRVRSPGLPVAVVGGLELRVGGRDGEGSQVFLYNAYDAYRRSPEQLETVLGNYAMALEQLGTVRDDPVDPERIVPVIKDRNWTRETLARVRSHPKYKAGQEQVFEHYNDELVVFYAEDLPHGIRYLTSAGAKQWGLNLERLRPLAVRNLRALLPQVQVLGSDGLYLISAGGNYEASLLLFETLWRTRKLEVPGDYVVAVPARDTLLVTGSEDFEGLRRVRETVAQVYPKAPYRLTDRLFVRQGERFEIFAE